MANTKPVSHARIVAAAQKEFEQYGFKDASMRNIATEAGMSASGLLMKLWQNAVVSVKH